jgi:hypothetical protein
MNKVHWHRNSIECTSLLIRQMGTIILIVLSSSYAFSMVKPGMRGMGAANEIANEYSIAFTHLLRERFGVTNVGRINTFPLCEGSAIKLDSNFNANTCGLFAIEDLIEGNNFEDGYRYLRKINFVISNVVDCKIFNEVNTIFDLLIKVGPVSGINISTALDIRLSRYELSLVDVSCDGQKARTISLNIDPKR